MAWLVATNVALAVVLAFWILRFRRLCAQLAHDRENNAELIENLSEGVYRSLPDGRQLSANKALVALNGYDSEAEMLVGVTDIGKQWYVDPTRRPLFREILHREGRVDNFVSEIFRHKTRERIWVTESARLVYDHRSANPIYYEGSVREITEAVERRKLAEQLTKLTQSLPIGLFQFVHSPHGTFEVLFLSEGASRVSGIPIEEQRADPSTFSALVVEEDRARYYESFGSSGANGTPWDCEFRITARDGVEKWVHIDAHTETVDGQVTWHGYIADISARKKQEMDIEKLAYFDPLTTLPNRRMFLARMEQGIARCGSDGTHGALLFIDLDNFKALNDTQGHDKGDLMLSQVAERIRGCVSEQDLVARIGGDEFVALLDGETPDSATASLKAISAANRILAEMNRDFMLGDLRHVGSASIGLVVFDGVGHGADDILKRADIALYQAKAAGRNGVAIFEQSCLAHEAERFEIVADLREALAKGHIALHFQPQLDFTGRVIGAEALVRWHHPRRGTVRPGDFIGLADQHGLGDTLTRVVFDAGLAALARWDQRSEMRHLRLSLNVSVQSFAGDAFLPMLNERIAFHGIDPTRLTLELTENVMARDRVKIARRMAEVKALGVRLSLDDFGTGYSSLGYLKQLPFDEIKIDGGFVADIEGTEGDRALVKTILSMAATLGLRSVAEHVENVRQEAFLRAYGCDVLQGHFYSRALPEADFARLFGAGRPVDTEVRKLLA